jgi:CheY-like chemotaxis protein
VIAVRQRPLEAELLINDVLKNPRNRILVADSNADMRKLIVAILGWEFDIVASVSSGESIVSIAHRALPDVIVSDTRFSRMSGLSAMHVLRTHGIHIPFVMVSIEEHDRTECREQGANAFVSKHELVSYLADAVCSVAAGNHYFR